MSATMHDLTYDVTFGESRNRLTTAFRIILAIPHAICMALWGYACSFAAIAQWAIVLFTGQRNDGIWRFHRNYLSYASRVNGYSYLLFDEYPGFFNDWKSEPVAFDFRTNDAPDRLSNALRLIWMIPAAVVAYFISIGVGIVAVVAWFAVVITGRMPRGMFDFILRGERVALRLMAYGLLATDEYPWFAGAEPTSVLPPGDGSRGISSGSGAPLPPPAYS